MNNVANWFILPVTDMQRAKQFYTSVLNTQLQDEGDDTYQMSVFEHELGGVSGMLLKADDYEPARTGSVVYFNAGDQSQMTEILERVAQAGTEIITPKSAIDDGKRGHCAQFLDSEGNRVGLYSPPAIS